MLPYLFHRPDDQTFAFAGLWEMWSKGNKPLESCTILTTAANELLAPFHDRMPVILFPNDYDVWLNPETNDPATLTYLFEPAPASELIATPVNPVMNNARHEGVDCVEELES
jgi:putative SOS response-associated peptidase YedK